MTMFRTHKPVPFVFMVSSVLYFFYVVSLGSSSMIGDEIGGDPGGMLLPLVLSIFMFVASAIIFLTDRRLPADAKERQGGAERRLFALTVVVAILYVAAMRPLGFIVSTVLLLFTLTFFYLQGTVGSNAFRAWAVGTLSSLVSTVVIYTIGRKITRYLMLAARANVVPQWMGSSTVTVLLVLLVVLAFYLLSVHVVRKRFAGNSENPVSTNAYKAGMIAVFTTELVYLVFRQMFLVELVRGLIYW